jgi:GntR family transcriptional regulator/MocR family aminotransferase
MAKQASCRILGRHHRSRWRAGSYGGHLARHLRRTRAIYDERRLAFLDEAKILADVLDFGPARARMHVTGLFKAGMSTRVDDRSVAAECARGG